MFPNPSKTSKCVVHKGLWILVWAGGGWACQVRCGAELSEDPSVALQLPSLQICSLHSAEVNLREMPRRLRHGLRPSGDFHRQNSDINCHQALAGVAQLVGHRPPNWKGADSIPGQGTGPGCRFSPQLLYVWWLWRKMSQKGVWVQVCGVVVQVSWAVRPPFVHPLTVQDADTVLIKIDRAWMRHI